MRLSLHGLGTVQFLLNHPLNVNDKLRALRQYARWQIASRLISGPLVADFVDDGVLLVRRGEHASVALYTGLFEFDEMGFVLHCLQEDELLLDVGANVGAFTILAATALGARSMAFEPIPHTFADLMATIRLNEAGDRVEAFNLGVGSAEGELEFITGYGAQNRVVTDADGDRNATTTVPVRTLDSLAAGRDARILKIDVEGFETEVIRGADRVLSDPGLLAVIMELNASGNRYGYDDVATHRKVLDYGFESYRYEPLRRELTPLGGQLNEQSINTIYVRDASEVSSRIRSAPKHLVQATGTEI